MAGLDFAQGPERIQIFPPKACKLPARDRWILALARFSLRMEANVALTGRFALLADGTFRPGDMVVFPDGVRVFRGKPGSRHQLPDFVKLTDTKRMASSDRKLWRVSSSARTLPGVLRRAAEQTGEECSGR